MPKPIQTATVTRRQRHLRAAALMALVQALALTACTERGLNAPRDDASASIAFAARIEASSTDLSLRLNARAGDTPLAERTVAFSTPGRRSVPFEIDLAPCLREAATCQVVITATLLAPGGETLDAASAGPLTLSPGESRTIDPPIVLREVNRVDVTPPTATVEAGRTSQLQATARNALGVVVSTSTPVWSSSAGGVAGVSGTGLVTGLARGTASITATIGGRSGSGSVTVQAPPFIVFPLDTIALISVAGGSIPASAQAAVGNSGDVQLTGLTVSVAAKGGGAAPWLTATLAATAAPTQVNVSASAASLGVGTYEADVTVRSSTRPDVAAQTKHVIFTVTGVPVLRLSRDTTGFVAASGSTPASQSINVTNAGSGVLTGLSVTVQYTVGPTQGWLQATVGAAAPTTLVLTASAVGRAAGTYGARVIVSTSIPNVAPDTVGVAFIVTAGPPVQLRIALGATALTTGQVTGASATVTDQAGNVLAGAPVNWSSSSPNVASVAGSGQGATVTAVAPGQAIISATSGNLTSNQLVVTVTAPAAGLVISAIRVSGTQTPANPVGLSGTIDVDVLINFPPIPPDSVAVTLGSVRITATGSPNQCTNPSGSCVLTVTGINTVAYTVNAGAGIGVPALPNGPSSITGQVYFTSFSPITGPPLAVTLANSDGFHGLLAAPATSATGPNGLWHGGPNGLVGMQVLPVSYSGRPIGSVSFRYGSGPAVTRASAPFTASVGVNTGPSYDGYVSAGGALETMGIFTSSYADGSPGPTGFVSGGQPVPTFRIDFAAPAGGTFGLVPPSANNWVAATYNFSAGYAPPVDAGVGLSAVARQYRRSGCGAANVAFNPAAHGIPECAGNLTTSAYSALVSEADALGSAATVPLATSFGVDLTAPTVSFTATSAADLSTFDLQGAKPPSPAWNVTSTDARSGVAANAAEVFVVRLTSSSASCPVGGGTPGAQPMTNPACTFAAPGSGATNVPSPRSGWFRYQVRVRDRVGNQSPALFRRLLADSLPPAVTPIFVPAGQAGGSTLNLNLPWSDDVERRESGLLIRYPLLDSLLGVNQGSLGYPAGAVTTTFDDVANNASVSFTLPVPFVRHVEAVLSNNTPVRWPSATLVPFAPTSVTGRATDHVAHEGAASVGTFTSVPPGPQFFGGPIGAFQGVAALGTPATIKVQAVLGSVGLPPPLKRVDYYVVLNWPGVGPRACYLGSSTTLTFVDVGNFRIYTWYLPASATQRSCLGPGQLTAGVGSVILAVGVSFADDGLATRLFTLTP